MNTVQQRALAATLILVAAAGLAAAQVTTPRRIHYTINVPHKMQMGDYLLPAGKYLLYQINSNDSNLFALYKGEARVGTPVAMIRTVPIDYWRRVEKTRLMVEVEESGGDAYPVIKGWTAPGEAGWEVISVHPKDGRVLTRIK